MLWSVCEFVKTGVYVYLFVTGVQMDRDSDENSSTHCCLVGIGRLQVTSTPNCSDLMGPNGSSEFISRHNMDGKFTFVDQR